MQRLHSMLSSDDSLNATRHATSTACTPCAAKPHNAIGCNLSKQGTSTHMLHSKQPSQSPASNSKLHALQTILPEHLCQTSAAHVPESSVRKQQRARVGNKSAPALFAFCPIIHMGACYSQEHAAAAVSIQCTPISSVQSHAWHMTTFTAKMHSAYKPNMHRQTA
jgi:hypothetical protein